MRRPLRRAPASLRGAHLAVRRVQANSVALLVAALALAGPAHAGLPTVAHDARVVEGNSGTAHLEFEVDADGPPRRLALAYSVTGVTASTADGDYSPASGVVELTPRPARLIDHWGAGELYPQAVALAPNGDIIVADGTHGQIFRYSREGTLLESHSAYNPSCVAVAPSGDIYMVSFFSDRVLRLDQHGNLIASWGGAGWADIEVDANGFVYTSDVVKNLVQKFDPNGHLVRTWNTALPDEPADDGPLGLAVDAQGNVYVGKGMSSRILKYAPDGSLAAIWTDTKGLCVPRGLHVDSAGNLLVADNHTSRVLVLDNQGVFLTEWTLDQGPEHNPDEFSATAIVSDDAGNVYVGNRYSSSIDHFRWDHAEGSVTVDVVGDTRFEDDETVQFALAPTPDASVVDGVAVGTIINDDLDLGTNQATNGTFDSGLQGWAPYQGVSLQLTTDGRNGSTGAHLLAQGALNFGINDSPDLVTTAGAGFRYLYSAWVRSNVSGSAKIRVREYQAKALQATTESAPVAFDGSWQRLAVPIRARTAGASLDFQVIGQFPSTGGEFWIDDVTAQALGRDVPPVLDVVSDVAGGGLREVVVEVAAHDPEGEPIEALEADLIELPGASFTVAADRTHGTLRWRPGFAGVRDAPYSVTFQARNAATTTATTRLRIGPNLVLNPSFEYDLSGWNGHLGTTLERVPGGRKDGFAARLRLPGAPWAGLTDSPNWAAPVGQQRTFVIGAWVRSDDDRSPVRLQVREFENGKLVGSSTREGSLFDSFRGLSPTWRRITLGYTCRAVGASDLDVTIDAQGSGGETFDVDDVSIIATGAPTVDVAEPHLAPQLAIQAFPNPCHGRAVFEIQLPMSGPFRLELYDLAGRKRRVVADEGHMSAGVHRFVLDAVRGLRLSPGMYWYRATTAMASRTARIVILE